jgi:hypothetical protein
MTTIDLNLSGTPLVLLPGDKVLISLSIDVLDMETIVEIKEKLAERFPGVEFTLLNGVEAIAVQPRTQDGTVPSTTREDASS